MKAQHKNPSQVEKLIEWLLFGLTVNRVDAFELMGIADLRSRIAEVDKFFGFKVPRERIEGKRYLRYYLPKTNYHAK